MSGWESNRTTSEHALKALPLEPTLSVSFSVFVVEESLISNNYVTAHSHFTFYHSFTLALELYFGTENIDVTCTKVKIRRRETYANLIRWILCSNAELWGPVFSIHF
jgi:hypothetical protein